MTVPSEPWPRPSGANVTVPPEVLASLPKASLSWIVSVVVVVPSAVSAPTLGVAVLVAVVMAPGVSVTAVGVVNAVPLSCGASVTGPATVPAV